MQSFPSQNNWRLLFFSYMVLSTREQDPYLFSCRYLTRCSKSITLSSFGVCVCAIYKLEQRSHSVSGNEANLTVDETILINVIDLIFSCAFVSRKSLSFFSKSPASCEIIKRSSALEHFSPVFRENILRSTISELETSSIALLCLEVYYIHPLRFESSFCGKRFGTWNFNH